MSMAVGKQDIFMFLAFVGLIFWLMIAVSIVFFHHAHGYEIPFLKLIATLPFTVAAVIVLGYFYAIMKGAIG